MSRLLMIVPAPVNRLADGHLRMDVKFVEGMRLHKALWPGAITVVMWDHGQAIPFGAEYAPDALGFDYLVLEPGHPVPQDVLLRHDRILASADMVETLDLAGPGKLPVTFSVEYTLGTRLRIVALDRGLSWPRKIWSMLWNLRMERRRRQAFRRCAGLQANGYPAYGAYAGLNPSTILYLDGRMRREMLATPEEMAARAASLRQGGPLRLVHSGRLEPMKGAQDLLPMAQRLVERGVDFTLDVFGTGSLEAELRVGAGALAGRLRVHAPMDFETELVPWMRAHADVFISCHRQSDPSCTYLESMGCGVPVLGYDNAMWAQMRADCGAGWLVPMARWSALADEVARLAVAREEIIEHAQRALTFAGFHDFETEFTRRMQHRAERGWDQARAAATEA
ncbi:MAG: glycosyltransferase [Rhodobacteraceae bacterium]|nr:glycosyltransferase [Paracoccaceae bacterium]MCF8513102.1 glycosyltransferase [Paracoccaceae bacterium]MCF8517346.1 glycosyltransferase [Paracoccaceae bacterium]